MIYGSAAASHIPHLQRCWCAAASDATRFLEAQHYVPLISGAASRGATPVAVMVDSITVQYPILDLDGNVSGCHSGRIILAATEAVAYKSVHVRLPRASFSMHVHTYAATCSFASLLNASNSVLCIKQPAVCSAIACSVIQASAPSQQATERCCHLHCCLCVELFSCRLRWM